jgi:hypothetical protein
VIRPNSSACWVSQAPTSAGFMLAGIAEVASGSAHTVIW